MMARLFSSLKLKGVVFKNRIFVSPMCQYSSVEGMPTDWHLVHLVSRAVGGAGLDPATRVLPEPPDAHAARLGRPDDLKLERTP